MVEETKSNLRTRGFYELRDSTCEKCEVKMTRIEPQNEGEKATFICPSCGGNVGRLKQRGVLLPEVGEDVKSK